MNSEVTWGIESSGTQVQPQIILDPDYLSDYLSVPYDYVQTSFIPIYFVIFNNLPKIPQCLILANFRCFEHLLKDAESVQKHFVAIFTRLRIKFSWL